MKKQKQKSPIADLVKALKKDDAYKIAWEANIAMAFYDNYRWHMGRKRRPSKADLYAISNKAARYFLTLLTE